MLENWGRKTRKLKLFRLASQSETPPICHKISSSRLFILGKFDLKNTVINIVAGLGLLSFITMFCDFVLLHYVKERKIVSHSALLDQQPIIYSKKIRNTSWILSHINIG